VKENDDVAVCSDVTDQSDPPYIPGDPLMQASPRRPQRELPEEKLAEPHRRPLPSQQRSVYREPSWFISRLVKPEARLAFSLVAVLGATIVLGHGGVSLDEPSTSITSTPSAETQDNPSLPINSGLKVIVSDPANTAIVREIAGELLQVDSVIPPGGNGHTYEPVPGDAVRIAQANLFIENGMDLNPAVSNFVKTNSQPGLVTVTLSDAIPSNEVLSTDSAAEIASHGHAHSFNAHFWTDPVYAISYANRIKVALATLDPANASYYEDRASKFVMRIQKLDELFRAAITSIPTQNKKLVVYHDSWSYFGRRYGISIVGAIQPVSFAEPSADEVRRMIDQIKREKVPAFFGSEVFPSDVLKTLANETGSRYYADLSDEELPGAPGTAEHSYEGMMIANVRLITSALGGDNSVLANVQPGANPS
jgi:ABC-type Zn uptake system ZnuABC Zn-binding protein ZnuA